MQHPSLFYLMPYRQRNFTLKLPNWLNFPKSSQTTYLPITKIIQQARDEETKARYWAIPGTEGFMYRNRDWKGLCKRKYFI